MTITMAAFTLSIIIPNATSPIVYWIQHPHTNHNIPSNYSIPGVRRRTQKSSHSPLNCSTIRNSLSAIPEEVDHPQLRKFILPSNLTLPHHSQHPQQLFNTGCSPTHPKTKQFALELRQQSAICNQPFPRNRSTFRLFAPWIGTTSPFGNQIDWVKDQQPLQFQQPISFFARVSLGLPTWPSKSVSLSTNRGTFGFVAPTEPPTPPFCNPPEYWEDQQPHQLQPSKLSVRGCGEYSIFILLQFIFFTSYSF